MKLLNKSSLCIITLQIFRHATALQLAPDAITRRKALKSFFGVSSTILSSQTFLPPPSIADEETYSATDTLFQYEKRDRKKNKNALIREDYWYFSGKQPPRRLSIDAFPADDPTWNAWGECTKSDATGNSCVYVSLKQRQPAYGKYAFSIQLGASEFQQLGDLLRMGVKNNGLSEKDWNAAAKFVDGGYEQRMPAPTVDALLKMALFATQMLTSPNYSGPSRELLVSRYYINETAFATKELASAIDKRDLNTALGLWDFGKDSWNSYLSIVNRAISPKVGDKFEMLV